MNLKLEQLRVFVAVAEAGTIIEAADRLGRTASAVSMTLSHIEHQLNGKLFDGERKSKLSPLGKFTLQQAKSAVESHRHAVDDIQRFANGDEGLSRIAVVPSVAIRILPQVVHQLRKQLPRLQVDIRDIDTNTIHDVVYEGQVDFGIASLADNNRLDADFLLEDSYRLICRHDHPLTRKNGPIKWTDISVDEFIVNGLCEHIADPGMQSMVDRSNLYIHNTLSILAFVKEGLGVTILPALTRPDEQSYAALQIDKLEVKRALYILKRKSVSLSPIDMRLINSIRISIAQLVLD
ncbi:MAG: LysR family carnitine catabolism transcriptional activator [Parasphingorhabdus sp.]|jgi:LysR family carnitine catabolism transcriptional activator